MKCFLTREQLPSVLCGMSFCAKHNINSLFYNRVTPCYRAGFGETEKALTHPSFFQLLRILMMHISAEDLLTALLEAKPRPTIEAPRDRRGLYGLVDHNGKLSYIGSTSSADQTFFQRIHLRHRTGSEGMSHYFSQMYNTGRMWRDRKDHLNKADGSLAKKLRNEFVIDHCRAVWLPLPDTIDIARLEVEVLSLAPEHAIAWNGRRMQAYDEPTALVEATLRRLGWGSQKLAAIDRQRLRFLSLISTPDVTVGKKSASNERPRVPSFPKGPFRFFALDVETANNDRGSICQIGVACVHHDGSIETWATYVDPQVDHWVFTRLHGISAQTVQGAPSFAEVLPLLQDALKGTTVYQHSGFDRSAIAAACRNGGLTIPEWDWRDSVQVARAAWPELRGNGGHGLANLQQHLGLMFEHHDAGEDARAAAEVVLRAEDLQPVGAMDPVRTARISDADDGDTAVVEKNLATVVKAETGVNMASTPSDRVAQEHAGLQIGTTEITQGNIDNSHINLRNFFDKFPADAIGGSNRASAAPREIAVDWGGSDLVATDLDGSKHIFRKRRWIRDFFERYGVCAGDTIRIEELAPYSYRVILQQRS